MRLFIGLLLITAAYYAGLCEMENLAVQQVVAIHDSYSAVAATADQWQQGGVSAPLTFSR